MFFKKPKCVTCVKSWPIKLIALSQSVNRTSFVHANGCTCHGVRMGSPPEEPLSGAIDSGHAQSLSAILDLTGVTG